jgi:hypothetical protein
MTTVRLKPLNPVAQEYEWDEANIWSPRRFALVGKCSGKIHAMFEFHELDHAFQMAELYDRLRDDAGYELMEVEYIQKTR